MEGYSGAAMRRHPAGRVSGLPALPAHGDPPLLLGAAGRRGGSAEGARAPRTRSHTVQPQIPHAQRKSSLKPPKNQAYREKKKNPMQRLCYKPTRIAPINLFSPFFLFISPCWQPSTSLCGGVGEAPDICRGRAHRACLLFLEGGDTAGWQLGFATAELPRKSLVGSAGASRSGPKGRLSLARLFFPVSNPRGRSSSARCSSRSAVAGALPDPEPCRPAPPLRCRPGMAMWFQ